MGLENITPWNLAAIELIDRISDYMDTGKIPISFFSRSIQSFRYSG